MRTVQVVPIVVGSLGNVTKNLDKWLGKLNVKISISLLHKTTLLGTARILRRVLELQSTEEENSKGPLVMGYDPLPWEANRKKRSSSSQR